MLVTNLGLQKVIPLLLLIGIGYLLKGKFQQPAAGGAIKNLIINAALPATVFLSIIDIDKKLGLFSLPALALILNFYLLFIGFLVARLVIEPEEKAQIRSLILMFPSLAPGITAYPFIEEFLGRKSIAFAALADVGNKVFILVGLCAVAMYWHQRVSSYSPNYSSQLKTIGFVLMGEPANAAIILGFLLLTFNLTVDDLPQPIFEVISKLAACTTPLILFFVGISFNSNSFKLQTVLSILFARSGAGFWFSAGAIALLKPDSITTTLAVILPQAGCSLWPFLYASQMNARGQPSLEKEKPPNPPTFDTEFALGILTTSIPFSICVILSVCSFRELLNSPLHLVIVGLVFFGIFGFLSLRSRLTNLDSQNVEFEFAFRIAVKKRTRPLPSLNNNPNIPNLSTNKILDKHSSSSISSEYRAIEQAENQLNLQFLSLLLEYRLQSEGLLDIKLRVNFFEREKRLAIAGHHPADKFPDKNKVFEVLKDEALSFLKLEFPVQVDFSLNIAGEEQPYSSVFFVIKPY